MTLQDLRNDPDETAKMHRDVLGLADGRPVPVEQRGRAIAALLNVCREAGADQRLAHLLDDSGQRVGNHLVGAG